MEYIKISEIVVNKILTYLAGRPFSEVYQLISALNDEMKKQKEEIDEEAKK